MPICVTVCGHNMLASDLWGDTFLPLLCQNLFFFGLVLWLFAGQERNASLTDSAQLIYLELSSAGSSG